MIFWCASPFYRYLDGSHCFDEICSAIGYSNQALDDLLDKFPDVIICWKWIFKKLSYSWKFSRDFSFANFAFHKIMHRNQIIVMVNTLFLIDLRNFNNPSKISSYRSRSTLHSLFLEQAQRLEKDPRCFTWSPFPLTCSSSPWVHARWFASLWLLAARPVLRSSENVCKPTTHLWRRLHPSLLPGRWCKRIRLCLASLVKNCLFYQEIIIIYYISLAPDLLQLQVQLCSYSWSKRAP